MQQLEGWPVKAILAVLIIIELYVIATQQFSFTFDDYIMVVVILLAFPLAYYTYHYLTMFTKHTTFYQINFSPYSDETAKAVEELTKSQAYKDHERKVGRPFGQPYQPEAKDGDDNDSVREIARELEEKEEQIFGNE